MLLQPTVAVPHLQPLLHLAVTDKLAAAGAPRHLQQQQQQQQQG
jgi:hypothetical protein